jgi:hypothetical protein
MQEVAEEARQKKGVIAKQIIANIEREYARVVATQQTQQE